MANKQNTDVGKRFEPICPECDADGLRVRKVRGKNRCLECGHEW